MASISFFCRATVASNYAAMLFQELIKQHRVHRLVAHGVDFPLSIASHQIGVHFSYFFSDEAEPLDVLRIKFVL